MNEAASAPEQPPRETDRAPWRLGYRPALDGVRGIAVLLVMGYHFGVPGFAGGGHTGVAIFFALSGFLITALLLEERVRGPIRLLGFYARRARRLVPALTALVAVILILAVLRGQLTEVGPEGAAVLLYVSNWGQYHEPISYAHLSHTWSLGVEEQFYIAWPMLLVAAFALGRQRGVLIAAIGVAAATIGLRLSGFYLAELERAIDTMMIGAAIAVVATSGKLRIPPVVGYAALAILLVLVATTTWPEVRQWQPLAVGIASAGVIGALVSGRSRLAIFLAWRPLAFTGRISYGLYLWHFAIGWELWPHLVEAGWHWLPTALILIVASYTAALASWRYVERPLLHERRSKPIDGVNRYPLLRAADATP